MVLQVERNHRSRADELEQTIWQMFAVVPHNRNFEVVVRDGSEQRVDVLLSQDIGRTFSCTTLLPANTDFSQQMDGLGAIRDMMVTALSAFRRANCNIVEHSWS